MSTELRLTDLACRKAKQVCGGYPISLGLTNIQVAAVVVAVLLTAGASLAASPEPSSVLAALAAAHERRPDFAVESRSVAVNLDAPVVTLMQSRAGWWNPPGTYHDPVIDQALPVVKSTRYACDRHEAVSVLVRRFVGPPADQATELRQLVSPTFWVEQHAISAKQATFIRYTTRIASEDRAMRLNGRVPHADVLGALIYPRLVDSVIVRLSAAGDVAAQADGASSVVTSADYGVRAWVDQDGALTAAELVSHTGEKRRYVFTGVAAATFFPARFPAEMRVYRDRDAPGRQTESELLEIELFAAPEALTSEDLANLDPTRLGLRLVERSGGVPASSSANPPPGATPWWRPRTSGLLLALLVGMLAFVVTIRLLRRRAHDHGSARAG